jgi:hypothetical protein
MAGVGLHPTYFRIRGRSANLTLVNGPDNYEFFQIGYRPTNGNGAKHKDFPSGSALSHYYSAFPKPNCDTCQGGANNNICTQGDNNGCACQAVTATQPHAPKVTNCATAVTASEIECCRQSGATQDSCSQRISGCGVNANLAAICQSALDPDG